MCSAQLCYNYSTSCSKHYEIVNDTIVLLKPFLDDHDNCSKGKLIFKVTGKRFLWCLSSSTFVSSMIGGVVRTVSGREVSECFSVQKEQKACVWPEDKPILNHIGALCQDSLCGRTFASSGSLFLGPYLIPKTCRGDNV